MKHQFPSVTDKESQHRAEHGWVKPRFGTPHWRVVGAGGDGMRLRSHLGAIQSQPFPSHSILQHLQRGRKLQEMAGLGGGALGKLPVGYSHWIWTNAQGWNALELGLTPCSVYPPEVLRVGLNPASSRVKALQDEERQKQDQDETLAASSASITRFHSNGFGPSSAAGAGKQE